MGTAVPRSIVVPSPRCSTWDAEAAGRRVEAVVYPWLVRGYLLAAAVTAVALVFVTAPYGRHARGGWGPSIRSAAGWVLMEAPAVLSMALCWALGRHDAMGTVFLGVWMAHYLHRTFVYPLRRAEARPMPRA